MTDMHTSVNLFSSDGLLKLAAELFYLVLLHLQCVEEVLVPPTHLLPVRTVGIHVHTCMQDMYTSLLTCISLSCIDVCLLLLSLKIMSLVQHLFMDERSTCVALNLCSGGHQESFKMG